MSKSSDKPAATPKGRLLVRSSAGAEFRVLDGEGSEVQRGTGERELALREGLYAVEWRSSGASSETLVRVLADGPPAVAAFAPAADTPTQANLAKSAPRVAKQLETELPSMKQHGSAIAVIIDTMRGVKDSLDDLRLRDDRDVAMRAASDRLPPVDLEANEAARYYGVPPGAYLISFRAMSGETMQQTVPALPGRTTMVFLSERSTNVLVANGDVFEARSETGCDVTRTAIISIAGGEEDRRIRERIRLARVLLHDIVAGFGSIGADFVAILEDPSTDPLLRLYAAVAVVARLEVRQSPTPDRPWPRGAAGRAFMGEWGERVLRWLSMDKGISTPDETAARWRLQELLGPDRKVRVQRSIARPPMLALPWRWAVARSAIDPAALPLSSANIAAARSASGTEPWLTWKAAAAKAAPASAMATDSEQIQRQAAFLAKKLKGLARTSEMGAQDHSKVSIGTALSALLPMLTPGAAAAAVHLYKSAAQGKTGSLQDLAVSLGSPASALGTRLTRTDAEIDAALVQIDAGKGDSDSDGDQRVVPLRRPITVPDDPQKGRFGLKSSVAGFTVSADFARTKNTGWIRIKLTVEGPADPREEAQFHLHDSFRPQMQKAAFHRKRAMIEVTAWGGFTVGVWLPRRKLALELDLALLPGAPEIIRSR